MIDDAAMIEAIAAQEAGLVLPKFDDLAGFAIGQSIQARAATESLPICVDIVRWDRQVFFCSLPGAQAANLVWCRRKTWVVRNRGISSYRALFQNKGERLYAPNVALSPAEYALSGGAFPLAVKGAGVIGAIAISGLQERDDHQLVAEALCDHLGLERARFALPTE